MKYIIKYLLVSILLASAIVIYLLCFTQQGLVLELQYLSRYVPGKIKIEHVSGTLFSAFTLENIAYEYTGQSTHIKSIDVAWFPSKLLAGKLAFDTLDIQDANIQLTDSSASQNTTTDTAALQKNLKLLSLLSFNKLNINNLALHKGNQTIIVQGTLADNWNLQWRFDLPNVNTLITDVHGSLTSHGNISGPRLSPDMSAVINGKQLVYGQEKIATLAAETHLVFQPEINSSFTVKITGMKLYEYGFNNIDVNTTGTIKHNKKELRAFLQLNTSNNIKANLSLAFPKFAGFNHTTQALTGNMTFSATDLSMLAELIPDVKNTRGVLRGTTMLMGTIKQPVFKMDLTLTNGSFSLPILGIQPDNITATGQLDNKLNLTFSGTLRSGAGTGQLQGSCDLTKPDFPLTLAARGTDLTIINLAEYKVLASPDINLLFAYPALKIQGKISIPQADITPKNFNSAVSLPDEVIFISQDQTAIATSSSVLLNLQLGLQLGDNVNIDYDNIKARLLGNININKIPDSPAQASGELYTVQGKYTAYGQKLTIETGRLIYTGNTLTNPGLNIRAVKQARRVVTQNVSSFNDKTQLQNIPIDTETLTVGVQVTGTADNPRIGLFSVPGDLSQGDILSYLLLGLPQSQASGAQGSALLTALSAYNPDASRVLGLTNKLQQNFGLNELNVESVETFNPTTQSVESTTSFIIGKQITQKLSIHYSIGLFNPISILNLRYQISKHWAVQSETSTIDSGADLMYVIERD
jgi:translocation and assembly module TamB